MKAPSPERPNTVPPQTPRFLQAWRIAQVFVWLVGVFILTQLVFVPTTGIHLFWNVLIPVAPVLFVIATGLWRNLCPLASTALFSRHWSSAKRAPMTPAQTGKLQLIAVVSLLLLIPLRHALFNFDGPATAAFILALGVVAVVVSLSFEWKSAWCSGLCPVHPVEKLYGMNQGFSFSNAHCDTCRRCVVLCPDSTPNNHALSAQRTRTQEITGILMAGGFPGFIWGWFQVPDVAGISSLLQIGTLYAYPMAGLGFTMALFLILRNFMRETMLVAIFAAAAVSCYYWFRLPALFGFGQFPEDGMLFDLTEVLPPWSMQALVIATTIFFFWWIVIRPRSRKSWVTRPPFAGKG